MKRSFISQIFKKKLVVTFLMTINILIAIGQNLSTEETVAYLNNHFSNSENKLFKYNLKVMDNNQIIISEQNLGWPRKNQIDDIRFNVNDIDLSRIYITDKFEICDGTKYDNLSVGTHITIHCRNNSKCIYDPGSSNEKYTCLVDLFIDISSYDLEKARNALIFLIKSARNSPTNKIIDNDPFAPSNINKSNQPSKSSTSVTKGPCNIKTVNRIDGTIVRYLNPELVGTGNNCELGLSIQTNGLDYFLSASIRYFTQAKKITGSLKIKLTNEQSLELPIYTSEFATMQNERLGLSIFYLNNSDIGKLKNSTIKTVAFQETGGIYQIIQLNQNYDVAMRHLNCLGK